ncbi:efflux RND transporter permease subunit [Halovulum dunhuangense]|uniref:Efflux RND transporter permease subunit n=1 Tax=Halovulum dunhuangense TaxID=1505036 RepID=A0A849L6V6_9RHOB|nr:efflux RND transporter permease subunit [Halovulum dunhuangense]NNU81874.1 efflux RND transporter permease subunit [Halovulum dunhuangense]
MTGIVDWAAGRARMILAFVLLSILAGVSAYIGLPKEGEPDIEVPALFVSVPFPGISAEDAEKLLVRPLENKLRDLDGLKSMSATAAEGYAGVALEFEFGWDKTGTLADVRARVDEAQAEFPNGADAVSINEINFSEFPILVVSLSGAVPERTLLRVATELQDEIESLPPILEAGLAGHRDEMLEVLVDPLKLQAYNVTAAELISVVSNNNRLIAAGEVRGDTGAFSVKIPSAFDSPQDVIALPIKTDGDRLVTVGDLADIRLTFEDPEGTARYNGETTVALQVVKRKGFNVIDTAALVRETVEARIASWPEDLRQAVRVDFSMDTSRDVASMVQQLEASVLTAIALVMIVVLAALGTRSALLVGFAIPTSFLLSFALLAVFEISISNIVMFGLILAVGMLVDGAIVVAEYADKRIAQGTGPMTAYREAAKRMFWPIIASTATTLCAFLPMLFWPGVAGEFMGNLPMTLIFVLSASLVVALIYLPVVGGVAGRISRTMNRMSDGLRGALPWAIRAALALLPVAGLYLGFLTLFRDGGSLLAGGALFMLSWMALAVIGATLSPRRAEPAPQAGYRRSPFGRVIAALTLNPVMPFVSIALVIAFVVGVFGYYGQNNNGVEFFVESEPERAIAHVRARGNLSLAEKDALVAQVEEIIAAEDGVRSIFAFAGEGGLSGNPAMSSGPLDSIGQVQIELDPWQDRFARGDAFKGKAILARINEKLADLPGIEAEISEAVMGPGQGKPVHLRLKGENWQELQQAAATVRAHFDAQTSLRDVEDSRPLPGIDWQIDVDTQKAGQFGADVTTVGVMVQLVTRGVTLDTMRVETSDEEIDIRARLPEGDRVLSTLDNLSVRTPTGLVPLSNFITREPVAKLGQIDRADGQRYFDVRADVVEGANANAEIAALTDWLETARPLPQGVSYEWTGDQEDQAESQAFLTSAFIGALGLMFVILLAQFNSVYNAVLVLIAVIFSVTGSLIGMLVMDQPFSIIMTGTGIVALAGIVVNNNIVLIDTYQEYARYMPRLEAIVRTAEDRIRPVLLTTITTMAGLAPMVLGLSVDFANGGYSIDSPTALWWKQLATAVVFGLGIATVLTLVVTPALLAVRVWAARGAYGAGLRMLALIRGRQSREASDRALAREASATGAEDLLWEEAPAPAPFIPGRTRAAE